MTADGKWIEGLSAETPLAKAAQTVFDARFATVKERRDDARNHLTEPDVVHDLRVSTRRAAAALRVFGDTARQSGVRRLKKQLRKLRHAAGDVRDQDVFLSHLRNRIAGRPDSERPGLDYLCGVWSANREGAAEPLDAILQRRKRWRRNVDRMAVRDDCGETLGNRAAKTIPDLVSKFDATLEEAVNPEGLHAARIAGKRLRYALELFIGCFEPSRLDRPYSLLEELQDTLGKVQDAHLNAQRIGSTLEFLRTYHKSAADRYFFGLEQWRSDLEAITTAGPQQFREWLDRWKPVVSDLGVATNST